jgi:endoglucanase
MDHNSQPGHPAVLQIVSFALALTTGLALLILSGCDEDTSSASVNKAFIRADGADLVVGEDDDVVQLRGANFYYDRVRSDDPSEPWQLADHTDWGVPVTDWYQQKHFGLARDLGMNVARINLSYRVFEDNAEPGDWKDSAWDLLDDLIAWGEDEDVYLIVDMHVAPGGAGIAAREGGGWRTWDEPEYQERFADLWREIARRYRSETRIAAYDLLNEPVPTESAGQWLDLAEELIAAIRSEDRNHLMIVEMPVWIFDRDDESPLGAFDLDVLGQFQFLVGDSNVMYDFHYYLPMAYTLQDETGVDGGTYPDAGVSETTFSGAAMPRTRAYLENEMETVLDFWREENVPVNFGEWSPSQSALLDEAGKGGLSYTADMLVLMDEQELNWQFYSFNKIYEVICCSDDSPTTATSEALIELFRSQLGAN